MDSTNLFCFVQVSGGVTAQQRHDIQVRVIAELEIQNLTQEAAVKAAAATAESATDPGAAAAPSDLAHAAKGTSDTAIAKGTTQEVSTHDGAVADAAAPGTPTLDRSALAAASASPNLLALQPAATAAQDVAQPAAPDAASTMSPSTEADPAASATAGGDGSDVMTARDHVDIAEILAAPAFQKQFIDMAAAAVAPLEPTEAAALDAADLAAAAHPGAARETAEAAAKEHEARMQSAKAALRKRLTTLEQVSDCLTPALCLMA